MEGRLTIRMNIMNSFGIDKNYEQFNFEEITVEELQMISGGSGGGGGSSWYGGSWDRGDRMGAAGLGIGSIALGVAIASTPVGLIGVMGAAMFSYWGGVSIGSAITGGAGWG
jgi:hypothetical protein